MKAVCGPKSSCTGMDTSCGPGSDCTGLGAQCNSAAEAQPVETAQSTPSSMQARSSKPASEPAAQTVYNHGCSSGSACQGREGTSETNGALFCCEERCDSCA